jgi:site-specific recombinase XerD
VCAQVGIEGLRWHDLRHSFASRLILAGADLRTVMELLGHRSIQQTQRYTHLTQAHLRDAVHRLRPPEV